VIAPGNRARSGRAGAVRGAIVVLAKWPQAGRAKRRLGRIIGSHRAARLAHAFLQDTLALAAQGAETTVVAFAPPSARRRFAALADGAILVSQPRGSFGSRLHHALDSGLVHGSVALVIGMDAPTVAPSTLRRAFRALDRADCVLGPAIDGGYYLIGARDPLPKALFHAMPWSTPGVLAETVRRGEALGLRIALLEAAYDVDDRDGLDRLRHDRAGLRRAPTTRRALVELRLLL